MRVEIDAQSFVFEELKVDADELIAMLKDSSHFYYFVNDGAEVTINKFEMTGLDKLIKFGKDE